MDKRVARYFVDLHKLVGDKSDPIDLTEENMQVEKGYWSGITELTISGKKFYAKEYRSLDSENGVLANKLYASAGLTVPKNNIIARKPKNKFSTEPNYETATQDVCSLGDTKVVVARNFRDYREVGKEYYIEDLSSFLKNKEYKEKLLEIMTPECYDALLGMFLLDEVTTNRDRHQGNYFFYKYPGSDKYNGIIPIDQDWSQVVTQMYEQDINFASFIKRDYSSHAPNGFSSTRCSYVTRIKNLRNLLNENALSANQIGMLKRALEFDYPKEIKKVCKIFGTQKEEKRVLTNAISYLWDFDRYTIGKDLGM